MNKRTNGKYNKTFIEKICCRSYADPIMDPPITYKSQGNDYMTCD